MNRKLRATLITALVVISIAAAIALAVLAAGQFWPDASTARIQWGNHSTPLATVFDSGPFEFAIAWAAITLAILIAVVAMLFAFTISAITLGTVAVFMAIPLILIGLLVGWIVHRNRRNLLSRHPPSGVQA